jgi:hypothetical protein
MEDLLQDAAKWTCEMLRKAKSRFDARTARRNRNYNGVSADQLLDVEPGDFIFPVLHVQMGLVNKALSHLVAWFEKHVEKLADGHADTRTKLIEAETEYEEAMEAYDAFVTVEPFLSLATKRKEYKTVTGDGKELLKEEIKGIEDEFQSHGGDLQGNSARTVMENSDALFDELEKTITDLMDDECELTQQDILNTMKEYRRMFTLLGSAFSLLRQILPSNSDLQTLEKTIDEADKVWKKLGISCTPKAHGLFDGHTLEQHTRLRGIGDKGEDFVEKGHQLGLRD